MLKENSIGQIKINKTLFARTIYNAICLTNDEIYMANENAKIIGTKNKKGSTNNLASKIVVLENEDTIDITFYVVFKFGTSIKSNAEIILNDIIDKLSNGFKGKNISLTMLVVGVKSKEIAKRDLVFKKSYEVK